MIDPAAEVARNGAEEYADDQSEAHGAEGDRNGIPRTVKAAHEQITAHFVGPEGVLGRGRLILVLAVHLRDIFIADEDEGIDHCQNQDQEKHQSDDGADVGTQALPGHDEARLSPVLIGDAAGGRGCFPAHAVTFLFFFLPM